MQKSWELSLENPAGWFLNLNYKTSLFARFVWQNIYLKISKNKQLIFSQITFVRMFSRLHVKIFLQNSV